MALSACGTESDSKAGGGEKITLVAPLWTNGQANVAVAAYLLEKELGYDVDLKEMAQDETWKALDSGKVDATLEDWDHPGYHDTYVRKRKTVVSGGELGITGRIGWYIPRYLADKNRETTRWENLNDNVGLFGGEAGEGEAGEGEAGEGEAGKKGVLLQGDPSFKSHDQALIDNLGLDYELKYLGSEDNQLKYMREAAETEQPFLSYWWRPHWVEEEVALAEVRLPEHSEGCDDDQSKVECGYPETELEKFLNADFAREGGPAVDFLKNFVWGEEEQNAVAKLIAGDGLSLKGAAEKWAESNESIWTRWFWERDS